MDPEKQPEEASRSHQVVESLLAKPSAKPNFCALPAPSILKRAQQFLPEFITSTDRMLADPELLKSKQMDVQITEGAQFNPAT